jgi:hypothetical protein
MEQSATEREIKLKTKQWIDEYGEDFLVELIGNYSGPADRNKFK